MVLRLHGEDGYLKKWGRHPFPVAALQDLRRLHLQHDTCALGHDVAVLWRVGGDLSAVAVLGQAVLAAHTSTVRAAGGISVRGCA
ncbi:hypothetical protein ABIE67_008880 [Streptomyces sp. V4I8]